MSPPSFAYYCSGHGYGHATRVSAFAAHLCSLPDAPVVHIVSSAPTHVFQDSIDRGARYRHAFIDPVIVQPLAYCVDRRKSVEVLQDFLDVKDQKVAEEAVWLKENNIDCVLSDAAFLACKAANAAGLPSVLITNFTFDSVYSYLSADLIDSIPTTLATSSTFYTNTTPSTITNFATLMPNTSLSREVHDIPIPPSVLSPLVHHIHSGYRCADLLLLLPGNIPIPSFHTHPGLPSFAWVDIIKNRFYPEVFNALSQDPSLAPLLPPVDFPSTSTSSYLPTPKPLGRRVRQAPLVVRHPSSDTYTASGRKRLLDSVGVPEQLQDGDTKILIVSFGGQVFRKPTSHATSRSGSPVQTPTRKNLSQTSLQGQRPKPLERCDSASSWSSSASTPPPETPRGLQEFHDVAALDHIDDDAHVGASMLDYPSAFGRRPSLDLYSDDDDKKSLAGSSQSSSSDELYKTTVRVHDIEEQIGATRDLKSLLESYARTAEETTASARSNWVHSRAMCPPPPSQLCIAGAPPARSRSSSIVQPPLRPVDINITVSQATPLIEKDEHDAIKSHLSCSLSGLNPSLTKETDTQEAFEQEPEPSMLPDASWIAIVCGATNEPRAGKEGGSVEDDEDDMPENFFTAPRDVYMPDLTAVADVLLGKLGYGTVSECVDSCTPFVYVPRPLFVEEHGLRRLLDSEGVGVELSRAAYEAGDWASAVNEAYVRGREAKAGKRAEGDTGKRKAEVRTMAGELVDWVREWQDAAVAQTENVTVET